MKQMTDSGAVKSTSHPQPERHYTLDALRGLAALSVVVWHYQHFFAIDHPMGAFDRSVQPFYGALSVLYRHGQEAVMLFFVLSGFVFFWLYRKAIQEDEISATEFFILRFSRLYPLHLVTLLLVAVLQNFYSSGTETYFVYRDNDLFHFLLNIGFASHWGLQSGLSFNGPVWSVSVEILLYTEFFILCRLGFSTLRGTVCVVLGSLVLVLMPGDFGSAFFCFFAGGLVYHFYEGLLGRGRDELKNYTMGSYFVLALAILCLVSISRTGSFETITHLVLIGVVFPILILSLVLTQTLCPGLGASWPAIGNLTYSIYLLHFPLQLGFVLAERYFGVMIDYTNPYVFLVFVALLMVLSTCSYYFLEMPAQSFVRRWYWSRNQTGPATSAEFEGKDHLVKDSLSG